MQDRYVGDVGDFAKYGLLRAIRGRKRLGVAWYLHPDAGPAGYGNHTTYLRRREGWRHLDPELFDTLNGLIGPGGRRSVDAVRTSGILGDAVFAADRLDIAGIAVRDRVRWRRRWFERVRNQLSGCDLVFADPDNGLCPDDRFRPTRSDSARRIPLAEANALAQGRTAVIYHHNSRVHGGHDQEIREWMRRLPGCNCAYYWKRWSNRTFFIVNPDDEIERRVREFADLWADGGQLVRDGAGLHHRVHISRGAGAGAAGSAPGRAPKMRADTLATDPVIEAYKRHVDRTLLRQNLRRSVTERVANLIALQRLAVAARRAGRALESSS